MEGENMKVQRLKGAESKGQPAREKEGQKWWEGPEMDKLGERGCYRGSLRDSTEQK